MSVRTSALPFLLVLPVAAGCGPTGPPASPVPTVTVTVTPSPTPEVDDPGSAPPDGDPLGAVRTVHEAWSTLDVQCRTSISGDTADAACAARDAVGPALERTAIEAYVVAWRARDAEALAALTPPPNQQESVDFVLGFTLPDDAEPTCLQLGSDEDGSVQEECTVVPVEGEGSEERLGWLMRLDPMWGDERLAPEIYVVANQIHYG